MLSIDSMIHFLSFFLVVEETRNCEQGKWNETSADKTNYGKILAVLPAFFFFYLVVVGALLEDTSMR